MYLYLLFILVLLLCLYYFTLEKNIILLLSLSIIVILYKLYNKNNYEKFNDINYYQNLNKLLLEYIKNKENNTKEYSKYKTLFLKNSADKNPFIDNSDEQIDKCDTINYNSKEINKQTMYDILKNI